MKYRERARYTFGAIFLDAFRLKILNALNAYEYLLPEITRQTRPSQSSPLQANIMATLR